MTKLVLNNIEKTYDNGFNAVKGVSFTADEGDFVVLVGPSGCGKTTLLRMIAGLEDISGGELYFSGKLMNNIEPAKRDVGMVFQNYALYPHMSVYDNIAFPLFVQKENKDLIKSKVEQVSELVGLGSLLKSKPKELSGGQRQRVALARAVVRKPKLFLFDEPLSNLDAKLRVQMRAEIIRIQRQFGTTAVYVTHDQTEAMTMGTRLVVLKDGEVKQVGSPAELYMQPADMFVAGFIGTPQMNFFSGNLHRNNDDIVFTEAGSSISFTLGNGNFENFLAKEYNELSIGIRPESFLLHKEKPNSRLFFEIKIDNIEYLGSETIVYFISCGELKSIKTESCQYKIGDKIFASFEFEKIHFFDKNEIRINKV